MRHQTFLISAFPQGKFGRRVGSKYANKPADSNFPLSVTMHFNEVDGLMLQFSNRPLGEHQLSLLCSIGAQLIASVMVTHKSWSVCFPHHFFFPSACLCCKWAFFFQWKAVKPDRNNVVLRLNGWKHKLSAVTDCQTMIELQDEWNGLNFVEWSECVCVHTFETVELFFNEWWPVSLYIYIYCICTH